MELRNKLRGTGVAMVTPFRKNMEIDYDSLGNLLDFVINNGVEYVITLGTTGETPTISVAERFDIINYTYEKVNYRVPVIVGMGGNNTREVMEDLQSYPLEKATAVLSASPYYNKPSQEGIFQHYANLAMASPKPVIVYNVPGRTGSNISSHTTLRLAHEVENIAGIKEASGDMIQCMHILRDRPGHFFVVSGDDFLALPLIACGMDGVISVTANCFPKDFSDMVRFAMKNDSASARPLHYKCLEGNDLLFAENNPAGVKAFLKEMGIIENVLRLPLVPLSEGIHQKIRAYLQKLNISK